MLRGRESTNIEDQRSGGGRTIALGGGGIGVLVLALVVYLCGGDPSRLLNLPGGQVDQQQPQQTQQENRPSTNDDQKKFVASVLGSTEDVWNKILPQQSRFRYRNPKLVLFTDQIQSACGNASSSTGPFYCPGDEKLYLDFAFFNELKNQFKAPGDFAQAYVIAHEVGHHVQKILGTMDKVNSLQQRSNESQSNQLSVRLELQADCYAGVWAFYAQKQGLVEAGDAEEAIRAAQAVGDDAIQKRAQGYVVPDSFTHGSARDRMTWFTKGMQSGDLRQCDTFR
ncbi:neutral zinc metallopeptidase [soil metagenome]